MSLLNRNVRVIIYVSVLDSDVNKDWTCKNKDQAYKDQDKD